MTFELQRWKCDEKVIHDDRRGKGRREKYLVMEERKERREIHPSSHTPSG